MITEHAARAAAQTVAQREGYFWDDPTVRVEWRESALNRQCWAVFTGHREVHWTEQELDDFDLILLIDAESGEFLGVDPGPRGISSGGR